VKKSELEHVIRAAKEITGETEFVIIGSQALHGAFPNLVDKLVTSHECDLYIPNSPEKTELLNSIGMLTPFAQTYGYYADPVDPDTAKLPKSWPRRRISISSRNTNGATYYCPSPEDLVFSKLAAGREKDFRFVRALLARNLIKLASVRRFIAAIEDPVFQKLMHDRLTIAANTVPDKPSQKRLRYDLSKLPPDRSRSSRGDLDR
jgi:Nucleotidyltransferase of unknown function (DUF6036)